MKTILAMPKGDLPIQIKKQLMREGYFPLEVTDPNRIKLLTASELGINGDLITMAALEAMMGQGNYSIRAHFTELLFDALKAKQALAGKEEE